MTKNVCHRMNLNPWRHKIRHRWRHIYDGKTNFVTDEQMWRHHSDQNKIVIKSSQNTNCDHSGVFNDVNVTSLMTTSLLVSNSPGTAPASPQLEASALPRTSQTPLPLVAQETPPEPEQVPTSIQGTRHEVSTGTQLCHLLLMNHS
jgi:hypothetical protein